MGNQPLSRILRVALGAALLSAAGCADHDAADCTSYDCESIDNVGGVDASANGGPGYPCDVYAVLQAKCLRCHGEPLRNGAPFSFTTWQDTQPDYLGKPRWQAMQNAVQTDFMPAVFFNSSDPPLQPPVEGLTPAEKQILLDWFKAGAPASEPGCEL